MGTADKSRPFIDGTLPGWHDRPVMAPVRVLSCFLLLGLATGLSGCVARAIADVATAPVRVAGKAVDLATTSQSEADEKRGREMRHREERLGKLERDWQRQSRRCNDGDEDACDRAEDLAGEIEDLRHSRW